jgi:hypothetical protein
VTEKFLLVRTANIRHHTIAPVAAPQMISNIPLPLENRL